MTSHLLVLGGTSEATGLCKHLAALPLKVTLSLAGRVSDPKPQPVPMRIGGFGGVDGLIQYLRSTQITHVIDATHPFAAQMSHNAAAACAAAGVPLLALTRAAWMPSTGDNWQHVPDIAGAVAALEGSAKRVFLAVGRMHLAAFAAQPQHHYLLRLVDPPTDPLPLPNSHVIVDRGPFGLAEDTALLRDHDITCVVSKNAGGSGASAKIHAARALGLPVIMIDRPALPSREEVHSTEEALAWLRTHEADLGV